MAKGKNSQNKKSAKKSARKNPLAKHDPSKDAPVIVSAKGGLTAAGVLTETLLKMEDDLRISKKQARDFVDSLEAVVEAALENGDPVNLFGFVKLTPRFHTKGTREVYNEFGNPESGKTKKKYPAKVTLKATISKKVKDMLPSAQKMGKKVGA